MLPPAISTGFLPDSDEAADVHRRRRCLAEVFGAMRCIGGAAQACGTAQRRGQQHRGAAAVVAVAHRRRPEDHGLVGDGDSGGAGPGGRAVVVKEVLRR